MRAKKDYSLPLFLVPVGSDLGGFGLGGDVEAERVGLLFGHGRQPGSVLESAQGLRSALMTRIKAGGNNPLP